MSVHIRSEVLKLVDLIVGQVWRSVKSCPLTSLSECILFISYEMIANVVIERIIQEIARQLKQCLETEENATNSFFLLPADLFFLVVRFQSAHAYLALCIHIWVINRVPEECHGRLFRIVLGEHFDVEFASVIWIVLILWAINDSLKMSRVSILRKELYSRYYSSDR